VSFDFGGMPFPFNSRKPATDHRPADGPGERDERARHHI
jgi:hypothetical protein